MRDLLIIGLFLGGSYWLLTRQPAGTPASLPAPGQHSAGTSPAASAQAASGGPSYGGGDPDPGLSWPMAYRDPMSAFDYWRLTLDPWFYGGTPYSQQYPAAPGVISV